MNNVYYCKVKNELMSYAVSPAGVECGKRVGLKQELSEIENPDGTTSYTQEGNPVLVFSEDRQTTWNLIEQKAFDNNSEYENFKNSLV